MKLDENLLRLDGKRVEICVGDLILGWANRPSEEGEPELSVYFQMFSHATIIPLTENSVTFPTHQNRRLNRMEEFGSRIVNESILSTPTADMDT